MIATIQSLLKASYDGGRWDVGQFRDSTALATGLTLGCVDNTATDQVKVMATYPGDFNLDGVVDGRIGHLVCERLHGHNVAAGRRQL